MDHESLKLSHNIVSKKCLSGTGNGFGFTLIKSYNIIVIRLNHYLQGILSRAENFRHSSLHNFINVVECD